MTGHMTGLEHWLKAEELLAAAEHIAEELDLTWPELRAKYETLLERAEVHAKLAASANVYGFHQAQFRPTADSPNIDPANAHQNGK